MKIGSVFDQTSTTEFVAMLDQQYDNERLLFSYVEISPDGQVPKAEGERIIARITNVHKENPLLSRDQAGVSASVDIQGLGFEFSRRFTYGWAQCTVIGTLTSRGLDMNRRVIAPNAQVHTPSEQTLRQMFFQSSPSNVPLGAIETFGDNDISQVPVTLDADQLVTKHFCVFGMTGSGKTNTAAKLIEELMARGHRMVIFDSHDDYINLEIFSNLFRDIGADGQPITLTRPPTHDAAVTEALRLLSPAPSGSRSADECVYERILRSASVIFNNTPARDLLRREIRSGAARMITPNLVRQLAQAQLWAQLMKYPQVTTRRAFPDLRFYGQSFADYTISLLQAFQGESYSSAQWRWLRQNINQPGTGITFVQNLWRAAQNARQSAGPQQILTLNVLQQSFNSIQAIYEDARNAGAEPLDIQSFFTDVASMANGKMETVYRLSLADLSSNLRKAMVYAIVTYFFRSFKFGDYRATLRNNQPANAYPVAFILEEARALIPKSAGQDDDDASGKKARQAMRELAYEGRKFSLGFGLISQKPSTVDQEVVSQANTFILHQLKSPDDQQYVRSVTESMSEDELSMVKSLGTGRAIVAGVAVRSPVLLRVYQRYSAEGIQEPTPIANALASVNQIRQALAPGGRTSTPTGATIQSPWPSTQDQGL